MFTSLFAYDPVTAYRRITYALLVCACTNAALLLPRDSRDFARAMGACAAVVLLMCYLAVVAMPATGVHQGNEVEAALAGDWRGIFGHKNSAAASMVYLVLFGLYLRRSFYPKLGSVIVLLAAVFLYATGGKTATAMLPTVLVLAWLFEHYTWMRSLLTVGCIGMLNFVLVGLPQFPGLIELLESLGIDATFTGRNAIWAFTLERVSERPLAGYGFQSFWGSGLLSKETTESWAFLAAHSHNAYLEALLNGGIPGLLFVVTWLLVLPLRDAGRALRSDNDRTLTRLFLRVWIFSIFLCCFENLFFVNTGPLWFTMLMAVFGLGLQAKASLRNGEPANRRPKARTGVSATLIAQAYTACTAVSSPSTEVESCLRDIDDALVEAVVCIPTFRRPKGLADTLTSLINQRGNVHFSIVVVENDAAAPVGAARAQAILSGSALPAAIVIEPRQGNCHAINRAFWEARERFRSAQYLLMIDDDEIADPDWVHRMVSTARETGAHVVGGPVIRRFETAVPASISRHSLYGFIEGVTRQVPVIHGTGNCLVHRSVFSRLESPLFDETFNFLGGGDMEFFARCRSAGLTFWWCKEATVFETIPHDRATARWLMRRSIRTGSINYVIDRKRATAPAAVAALQVKNAISLGLSFYRALCILAATRRLLPSTHPLLTSVGRLTASLGFLPRPYEASAIAPAATSDPTLSAGT
eukprot:g3903.t1